MDIYNKTTIASENGDFLTVIEQLARLVRRLMDFQSMQRESLTKARVLESINQLEYYARLMARNPPTVSAEVPAVSNRTDSLSRLISVFTGFVDGSF